MAREEAAVHDAMTCDGRLFQRRAAATGNAPSPTVDRRVRRTSRRRITSRRTRWVAIWDQLMIWKQQWRRVFYYPPSQSVNPDNKVH